VFFLVKLFKTWKLILTWLPDKKPFLGVWKQHILKIFSYLSSSMDWANTCLP
jgi:hypothetical protein